MIIEKKIKLGNNLYFAQVEVEYKKNKDDLTILKIQNYKDDYYDGGDWSILIEKVEENYSSEKVKKYDEQIGFMADVLYIYDRIPFINGIRDIYFSSKDNIPYSMSFISKEEIEKYIKENNVVMNPKKNFKLYDERTWFL